MKPQHKWVLIVLILIPLAVGGVSALISGNMSTYSTLNQPALSPPGFVFPIAWTVLYMLMGISSYIVYYSISSGKFRALLLYGIQLLLNFCWSIIFFKLNLYLFAFIWLIALIYVIVLMIKQFYIVKPLASYLQIPYLLWCLFAAYLNLFISILN